MTRAQDNQNGTTNASNLGSFKKKCLIIAILETDGRTQATAALGRVVIDLAEFAAVDKQETRAFMVSCNRQIHSAVGEPQLLLTIRARWKKSSATVGYTGDDAVDETGSMSTDTTGSRMTQNLSSFLRFKYTGKGAAAHNEEQDLNGFESSQGRPKDAFSNLPTKSVGMGTIQEAQDEPDSPPPINGSHHQLLTPSSSPGLEAGGSAAASILGAGGSLRARNAASISAFGNGSSSSMPDGAAHNNGALAKAAAGVLLAQGSEATAPCPAPGPGGWLASSGAAGVDDGFSAQPSVSGLSTPIPGQHRSASLFAGLSLHSAGSLNFDGMQQELVSCVVTEVVVHLARMTAATSKRKERAVHGAARRLARTLVCLGPQQAPAFANHALRLIASSVECSAGDPSGLAFWWSNLVQLRGLMQSSTLPASAALAGAVVPQALATEQRTFQLLLTIVWNELTAPAVVGGTNASQAAPVSGQPAGQATKQSPNISSRRLQQEGAVKKWFEGLDKVKLFLQAISPMPALQDDNSQCSSAGHMALLRSQLLLQCLRRLDLLLFFNLLATGPGADSLLIDYDPSASLWGAPDKPAPVLLTAYTPFSRGQLTFGSGMSVKMIVTRLQQWADGSGSAGAQDPASAAAMLATTLPAHPGMHSLGSSGSGMATPVLFPLLRAAADLLMMPKEMLMDPSIRRDCGQALSARTVLFILDNFQPDEYAADPISPDILAELREDNLQGGAAVGAVGMPPLTHMSTVYRPPAEDLLTAKVHAGQEPGLEYDCDSEDELVSMASAGLSGLASRYRLLHDLWTRHSAPRPRSLASMSSSASPAIAAFPGN
ncbi:hypothetical protein QJQ45_004301 [Haematococcus lacustris]|nr:hypothetical protein QJQ45_004301 [Haematococcus lacustris]